ncbi:hypothetical protein L6259_00565 [Candidatus Parcubacteria bacterium]|nr:hypothetical protein [Candidatus Parcubacteria bacterium]
MKISIKNILISLIVIYVISISVWGIYKYTSGYYEVAVYLEENVNQQDVFNQITNQTGGKIIPEAFLGYFSIKVPKWKNFQKININKVVEQLKEMQDIKKVQFPAPPLPAPSK